MRYNEKDSICGVVADITLSFQVASSVVLCMARHAVSAVILDERVDRAWVHKRSLCMVCRFSQADVQAQGIVELFWLSEQLTRK